jgi:hypothetical protein
MKAILTESVAVANATARAIAFLLTEHLGSCAAITDRSLVT